MAREFTEHESFYIPDQKLWVAKDFGTFRLLTDGAFYYIESPDRKGVSLLESAVQGAEVAQVSTIDRFFMALKEEVKTLAVLFIKQNPGCLLMDVIGYIEAFRDRTYADLAKVLLEAYGRIGEAKGLFTFPENADEDQRFEILRDFIANTLPDELEVLLDF